ncbi:MAG: RNA polymerase factor sigma-54 [Bacteroidales bacterium]|nr:RNA polymerase factor sigma-54 [Bacteroidales bacterium]MBQ7214344.1 RNA polymerase factor sigma-54 [Bacteroidales bacterium]MBR3287080.1 RNA polymerase factor sigma-54 [Bacteroidales bacterium]MCR5715090.1 RNA polymerase factor sigma-54 [Bacteroidales bacterium]
MLDQRLQQKLIQKLSPQQIQLIKLLEIPTTQLEQRIKEELENNPALEEGTESSPEEEESAEQEKTAQEQSEKDFSIEDYLSSDSTPSYRLSARNYSADEQRGEIPFSIGESFHENLISQLGMRVEDERQRQLGVYLIGDIDDDGYLRRDLTSIADDWAFATGQEVDVPVWESLLALIQTFDPVGVGARNLRECLLIQLRNKERTPAVVRAEQVLTQYFDDFSKRHYEKIMTRLSISEEEMKQVIDEVLKLNPKPGGASGNHNTKTADHIIPDFILENNDGTLSLSLNARNVPELKVSRMYSEMLQGYLANKNATRQEKDAVTFVRQKLDAAKWFIEAIKQRQQTLMATMQAIIDYQKDYFLNSGDEALLVPMILKDIADKTNLDISTISRVANSKYIQTYFGVYPLKFFFSEGMQTESGEEVSTREIKKILQECVDGESKRKPLTDDQLAEILKKRGYPIARRTVAKYREQTGIPVARLRKKL